MNQSCTIVIPCYNEERRFPLAGFTEYVRAHPGIRFLLVNDGSRDNTLEVLRQARQGLEEQVDILDQKVNGGKAEAVRAGMLAAMDRPGCEVAGFWDADMATPLEQIEDLAGTLTGHPEILMVFGSRVKATPVPESSPMFPKTIVTTFTAVPRSCGILWLVR